MLRKQLDQAQADLLRKDLEMARVRAGQPAATGLPVHRPPHGRRDVLPPGHESEPVSSTIWTRPVGNQGINYGGIHNNQAAYAGRLPEGTHHNYPMAYPIGQVQGQRVFSDPASNAMASMDSIFEEMHQPSRRRGDTAPLRNTSFSTRASLWNPQPQYAGPGGAKPIYIGATTTPYVHYPNQYAPRPIGTPLSATATEFSGPAGSGSHWNDNVSFPNPKLTFVAN